MKKGFTLIEIVVSVAIMGLIASVFITAFSNYFVWMVQTKNNITIEAFEAQKEIENNINRIKTAASNNENPESDDYTSVSEDIMLFKTNFPKSSFPLRTNTKIYVTEASMLNGEKLIAWVGDVRLKPLPVPLLDSPVLKFNRNGVISSVESDRMEYYNYSKLTLYSATTLKDNVLNSFYKNKHEWFVSEPGFLIPMPNNIEEINVDYDLGRIYPSFPNNYQPVPIYSPLLTIANYDNLSNDIVKRYPGRHIIHTVTPYSKDLKRGETQVSFPLYIMGPTSLSNLMLHLDASMIRVEDSNQVEEIASMGYTVKLWKNLRPSPATTNGSNALALNQNERAVLVSDKIYGQPDYIGPQLPFQGELTENPTIWGRALGNSPINLGNNSSSMSINGISMNKAGSYNIFIILRKSSYPRGPVVGGESLLKGVDSSKSWSLDWISDSQISLKAPFIPTNEQGATLPEFYSSYILESNEWNLLNLKFDSGKISYDIYNLTKDKENVFTESNEIDKVDFYDISTSGLELNFNGIDIAELLIYQNLDNTSIENTTDYLKQKYNN